MSSFLDLPISSNQSSKKFKVLFVCRGSIQDGLGHVTRTQTIAWAMRRVASVKIAVIGDKYAKNLLLEKKLDFTIVSKEEEVLDIFNRFGPEVVIFDLIFFDKKHFQNIRQSTKIISLSPIFNFLSEVDLFFHRSVYFQDPSFIKSGQPLIKSGLEYAIVSDHCARIPEEVYRKNLSSQKLSIAISMGGTDAVNKTMDVIRTIKNIPNKLLLWVLLGEGYAHSYQDLVDDIRGTRHEIILAKTNDSMWHILSTCSLAILAGGTTTYEAAFAGLPSINTLETGEHYFLIQELVEKGVCLCAGKTFPESLKSFNEVITYLNEERRELMAMHLSSKGLIDGLGVRRIVSEIQKFCIKEP